MRRLWLVVLSVLVLCGCTVTEKEAVFPPEISIETVDVTLFEELYNENTKRWEGEGITVFQDKVVVVNKTEDGSEYYLVSMDGKSHELIEKFPNQRAVTDEVATNTHFYLTLCETVFNDAGKVDKYIDRIYSCSLDGCEMIREEIEIPEQYVIYGPKYELEVYQNQLYMMYRTDVIGGIGNILFKYSEDNKEWETVLEIKESIISEELVANDEYLGLTYYTYHDNGYTLYMNLITDDGLSVETFDLLDDEYRVNMFTGPIIYNDHIAIPVENRNDRVCNMLVYTDGYSVQESTVSCRDYLQEVNNDGIYIGTTTNLRHNLNKVSDDKVETVPINYGDIRFSSFVSKLHVIDDHTIMNISNNEGKWHIIHLSQE